jgi:hypothetical protein
MLLLLGLPSCCCWRLAQAAAAAASQQLRGSAKWVNKHGHTGHTELYLVIGVAHIQAYTAAAVAGGRDFTLPRNRAGPGYQRRECNASHRRTPQLHSIPPAMLDASD